MIIKVDYKILKSLTPTEERIVTYINTNSDKLLNMSIVDVAEETFTSPATVSRTIKKCGIGGFTELRYRISKENDEKSDLGQINEILQKSLSEVTNTVEEMSIDDVLHAVELIKKSKKIYVLSRGLTELVADEFSLKLQLLGFNVFNISDPNIMKRISGEMKADELLFIFSLYGKTEELISSAENAISLGCSIITCCCAEDTPLKSLSTLYLKGYKHNQISIKKFEVTSRLPLYVISRIIIDYLAM